MILTSRVLFLSKPIIMAKGNVLIVDDNKNVLSALTILLQNEFGKVHCISNPNILLQAIREEDIDVVLLDMNFKAGINSGNEHRIIRNKKCSLPFMC